MMMNYLAESAGVYFRFRLSINRIMLFLSNCCLLLFFFFFSSNMNADKAIRFTVPPHDQSPAPPSLSSRQMPPPSSPPNFLNRIQPSASSQMSPSFLPREPPSNPPNRPGSSMSISSMLGSDAGNPPRERGISLFSRPPTSSSPLFNSAPPPSAPTTLSPPSVPSRHSSLDFPLIRRPHSPEKPISGGQPGRIYGSAIGSSHSFPEQPKFGGLPRSHSSAQYPERPSPRIPTAESPFNDSRQLSTSATIPRPSSQPQYVEPPLRMATYSPLSLAGPPPPLVERSQGAPPRPSSIVALDSQPGRFSGLFADRRQSEEQAQRDRERTLSRESELKPPPGPFRFGSQYTERETPDRLSSVAWERGRSLQPPSPESKRFSTTDPGSGFSFGNIQSYTKSLGSSQMPSTRPPPPFSVQSRQDHHSHLSAEQQPYLGRTQPPLRHHSTTPATSVDHPPFGISTTPDSQRRKGSEELMQHRSMLGVGLEGKRGGRASPLPQAVQGAQGQIGESSMKNELGRVFSGIGSGVGGFSASASGSGPTTPMSASPFKRDSYASRSVLGDAAVDDEKVVGPAVRKANRRSRDEEGQLDIEGGFAEPRSGISSRGRRGRHFHHHHQ